MLIYSEKSIKRNCQNIETNKAVLSFWVLTQCYNKFNTTSANAEIKSKRKLNVVHYAPHITTEYTHTFNGPLSRTNRVSRYQKGKTNLDFTEARASEWQWHQMGHMQVCTSLQTDNHAITPPLSFLQAGIIYRIIL